VVGVIDLSTVLRSIDLVEDNFEPGTIGKLLAGCPKRGFVGAVRLGEEEPPMADVAAKREGGTGFIPVERECACSLSCEGESFPFTEGGPEVCKRESPLAIISLASRLCRGLFAFEGSERVVFFERLSQIRGSEAKVTLGFFFKAMGGVVTSGRGKANLGPGWCRCVELGFRTTLHLSIALLTKRGYTKSISATSFRSFFRNGYAFLEK
jgi:hypothetical protein